MSLHSNGQVLSELLNANKKFKKAIQARTKAYTDVIKAELDVDKAKSELEFAKGGANKIKIVKPALKSTKKKVISMRVRK